MSEKNDVQYLINSMAKFDDYEDFPVVSFYCNKYKTIPSTVRFYAAYNFADFMKKIKGINSGFYFDRKRSYSHDVKVIETSFICAEYESRKLILYISPNQDPGDGNDAVLSGSEADYFAITIVYDPQDDTNEIIKLVKEKIIGLNEIALPREEKQRLNILIQDGGSGFDLVEKDIASPVIDFLLNYNEDFETVHKLIVEKLSIENSKGLVLLHGDAGTGKTTYVRHLINTLKKRVIYIPPNMTNAIADPSLIKFFMEYSNSILIIEDAESVLMSRVAGSTQAIANILNLTDGLLSDCMNMQIVATFNTSLLNIDTALLRKGRLIAKYEFKELEASRANLLAKKLGVKMDGTHTLADIYNAEETSFTKKNKSIRFKTETATA